MLHRLSDVLTWSGTAILMLSLGLIVLCYLAKLLPYSDSLGQRPSFLTPPEVFDTLRKQRGVVARHKGPYSEETESQTNAYSTQANTQVALINPSTQELLDRISVKDLEDGPPKTIIKGTPPELQFVERRQLAIPTRIPCRLIIKKVEANENDPTKICHKDLFLMPWQKLRAFERCGKVARDFIKPAAGLELYENTKHFRIMKVSAPPRRDMWEGYRKIQQQTRGESQNMGEIEVHIGSIDKDQEFGEQLPRQLAHHLSVDRASVFLLEVTFSFTVIKPHDINSCKGKDCIDDVEFDLFQKRVKVKSHVPGAKQKFIPDRYLNKYLSADLIKHLVNQDEVLRKLLRTSTEVEDLVEFIHDRALRMFAGCIMADKDISRMYSFQKAQVHDTDIFQYSTESPSAWDLELKEKTMRLLEEHCPKTPPAMSLSKLKKEFPLVKAHIFKTSRRNEGPLHSKPQPQHEEISPTVVLPIIKRERAGSGGYGVVYRIRIHEDHHEFSPNKHELFALKAIGRNPESWEGTSDRKNHIDKEKDNLHLLAKNPHPHLTPMLGSWCQGQECSILMPLAERDLHQFVTDVKPLADFDETFLQWLFTQTHGLAQALKFLHDHCGGYHHDLKLKNILVFSGDVLKISDFGTARISALSQSGTQRQISYSHHTQERLAASGYEAPDYAKWSVLSKPQDVWSLGCIFLELVVWAFGKDVQAFADQRNIDPSTTNGGVRPQSFWYRVSKNDSFEYFLKPCVDDMITELKEHERREDSLTMFLEAIQCMLRIDAYVPIAGDNKHVKSKTGTNFRDDMRNVVEKLDKIKAETYLDRRNQRKTKSLDDTSQAGTIVTVRKRMQDPSEEEILPVHNVVPDDKLPAPNGGHQLVLPDIVLGQSRQNDGNHLDNTSQSSDKEVLAEQDQMQSQLSQLALREPRSQSEYDSGSEGSSSAVSTS